MQVVGSRPGRMYRHTEDEDVEEEVLADVETYRSVELPEVAFLDVNDSWESSFGQPSYRTKTTDSAFYTNGTNSQRIYNDGKLYDTHQNTTCDKNWLKERYDSDYNKFRNCNNEEFILIDGTIEPAGRDEDEQISNGTRKELCHRRHTINVPELHNLTSRRNSTNTNNSSEPESTNSDRILNRRQFHRANFIRARYPVKFHDEKSASEKQKYRLPKSLCPVQRYGKEPRIQTAKDDSKRTKKWPQVPKYPPKARHTGVECEILKLVDTLDSGAQCTVETSCSEVQCMPDTTEMGTQYPRVKRKSISTQIKTRYRDQATQCLPETKNKMVETSMRILYFPEINTQHNWTQTEDSDLYTNADEVTDGSNNFDKSAKKEAEDSYFDKGVDEGTINKHEENHVHHSNDRERDGEDTSGSCPESLDEDSEPEHETRDRQASSEVTDTLKGNTTKETGSECHSNKFSSDTGQNKAVDSEPSHSEESDFSNEEDGPCSARKAANDSGDGSDVDVGPEQKDLDIDSAQTENNNVINSTVEDRGNEGNDKVWDETFTADAKRSTEIQKNSLIQKMFPQIDIVVDECSENEMPD